MKTTDSGATWTSIASSLPAAVSSSSSFSFHAISSVGTAGIANVI